MPSSSNPRPRRDSGGAPPTPVRRGASPSRASSSPSPASRTVDISSSGRGAAGKTANRKAVDPGVKRRAQKKAQARQRGLVAWIVAVAVSVMIAGAAAGVWSELASTRARAAQKRATLADLSAQLDVGKRRLQALSSATGKERILVENGFIKPGERLLLFPKIPSKK